MKKIITTVFCTAIALCSGLNVYAAEILERDYIEAETFPKHHTNIIFLTSGLTRTMVQKIMTGLR